jgi:hypothetical protein
MMRGMVPPDPETQVSQEHFAVVYVPRRNRSRFAASCVSVVDSRPAALAQGEPERHRYAARVLGPSRSSEGLSLYYLVEWLD